VVFGSPPTNFTIRRDDRTPEADYPGEAATAFQHWKDKFATARGTRRPDPAFSRAKTIDNVDGDVLAAFIIRNTAVLTPI